MTRTNRAAGFAGAAAVLLLAGCGIRNDPAILSDTTISVVATTENTITISWTPAENEGSLGRRFDYEVYTWSAPINSRGDLDDATLKLVGTARSFGDETSSAVIEGLSSGTGYYVNVAAVNTRSDDIELYDGELAVTAGGLQVADTYDGSVPYFNRAAGGAGSSVAIEYSIDLGAVPKDLYVVFSNGGGADLDRPEVWPGSLADVSFSREPVATTVKRSVVATGVAPVILRDNPEIAGWQAPPLSRTARSLSAPPSPSYDIEGASAQFFVDEQSTTINATCRKVVTDGAVTLNIWVENGEWDPPPTANGKINQEIVDFIADNFLATGADNDIYDWLTNLYGPEWEDPPPPFNYSNIIPDNDQITILLLNIRNDGPGGIVGYFWAKDNFVQGNGPGEVPYSNERVMFYMDSQSLGARPQNEPWDPTDFWPKEMVATLAHEFQHMIHFYQRGILGNASTPTWMEEMMAMVSEDLVARKLWNENNLDMKGPRGVEPSWDSGSGTAGPASNSDGRMPLYNEEPSLSLTRWLSDESVLKSYSMAYSFGAFLARAYGGAQLYAAMMDSASSAPENVLTAAIAAVPGGASGVTMDELMWRWGTSVLLSDDTAAPAALRLNSGGWTETDVGGITYGLGSIDAFRYQQDVSGGDGPRVFTSADYGLSEIEGMSNVFYRLAQGATGTFSAVLLVPTGVNYTVVVK